MAANRQFHDPRAKLQLHVDINQTIMVADPAGGVGLIEGINIAIAKAAYVKRKDGTPLYMGNPKPATSLLWHDDTPVDISERSYGEHDTLPALVRTVMRVSVISESSDAARFIGKAPDGCMSCYDLYGRERSKHFVDKEIGKIYHAVVSDLLELLKWPPDVPPIPDLTTVEKGTHYYLIVPSFFNLLMRLKLDGRQFNLILRTMGSDLEDVARAIDAFCAEQHPAFAQAMKFVTMTDVKAKGSVGWTMERGGEGSEEKVKSGNAVFDDVAGDEAISDFFDKAQHTLGVRDDYSYWKAANFLPDAGKPMWLTLDNFRVHPIFFDDNIHYKEDDSIVCVKYRPNARQPFRTLSGECTLRLHHVTLVKADIIQAILDPLYFLQCIDQCESNMIRMRNRPDFLEIE